MLPLALVDGSVHTFQIAAGAHGVPEDLLFKWAQANWVIRLANPLQISDFEEVYPVVLYDSKVNKQYWRNIYAEENNICVYKDGRGEKSEVFEVVKQALHTVTKVYSCPYFEADDLFGEAWRIHKSARKGGHPLGKRRVFISSVDFDLLQLVDYYFTHVTTGPWAPRIKGVREALDYIEKKDRIRLRSLQFFPRLKAIKGDRGDALPALCGIELVDLTEPPCKYYNFSLDDWGQRDDFVEELGSNKSNSFAQSRQKAVNFLLNRGLPICSF